MAILDHPHHARSSRPGCSRRRWATVFAALILLAFAPSTFAQVLDASDTPFGYSLLDVAKLTALYNSGAANGLPNTPPTPAIPFDILVNGSNMTIPANTYLYLPIYFLDDSQVSLGTLPPDLSDQAADRAFVDSYLEQYGETSTFIDIDSNLTPLTDDYIVGIDTPPLLDGGGTHYFVDAAFIAPLSPGVHSIGIGVVQDGVAYDFQSPYAINVAAPEPTSTAITLLLGGTLLLARRRRNSPCSSLH